MHRNKFRENTFYYTIGTGSKHVLVLHGWNSSIKSWEDFFDKADKENFTFYFPELPGFGDSAPPTEPIGVAEYVKFAQEFMKSLDKKPEYLLVHSFGGRIALKWLAEGHEFKKAIFVGAAGIKPELPMYKKVVQKLSPAFRFLRKLPVIRKFAYKMLGATDYLEAEGVMRETFKRVISEDLSHNLRNVNIPVHLVWGRGDTYTPLWMAKQMKNEIPGAKLTILDEARHGVHMQTPEKLATIVAEFFIE